MCFLGYLHVIAMLRSDSLLQFVTSVKKLDTIMEGILTILLQDQLHNDGFR